MGNCNTTYVEEKGIITRYHSVPKWKHTFQYTLDFGGVLPGLQSIEQIHGNVKTNTDNSRLKIAIRNAGKPEYEITIIFDPSTGKITDLDLFVNEKAYDIKLKRRFNFPSGWSFEFYSDDIKELDLEVILQKRVYIDTEKSNRENAAHKVGAIQGLNAPPVVTQNL